MSSFSKNFSIYAYAIFNGQSFNDTLTKDIVSFEQLDPDLRWVPGKAVLRDCGIS